MPVLRPGAVPRSELILLFPAVAFGSRPGTFSTPLALFAYRRLTRTGTTLWDASTSAVVLHKKWGVFRALACTAAVFAVLILISALNAAGK